MKYLAQGAKKTHKIYEGNNRYWLYLIGFAALIVWNFLFFSEELVSAIIKDFIFYSVMLGLIEFVFKPKQLLSMNFESDKIEFEFTKKKYNKTINHSHLKSIDTTMTEIVIKTTDGNTLKVPLSDFFYNEVIAIKEEVFILQDKLTNSLELLATE